MRLSNRSFTVCKLFCILQVMEPGLCRNEAKYRYIVLQALVTSAWWGLYILVFILFLPCLHLVLFMYYTPLTQPRY